MNDDIVTNYYDRKLMLIKLSWNVSNVSPYYTKILFNMATFKSILFYLVLVFTY